MLHSNAWEFLAYVDKYVLSRFMLVHMYRSFLFRYLFPKGHSSKNAFGFDLSVSLIH